MASSQVVRSPRRGGASAKSTTDYLPAIPQLSKGHIPKRYEDTKPMMMQNFTHGRIIGLGELINKRNQDEAEERRCIAIQRAVADTWEEAEINKQQAIQAAKERASLEHEKSLRKFQRAHDRALKEEALKVEAIMQKTMRETLEAEQITAEKILKETVAQVKQECYEELLQAVEEARIEEKDIAEENYQLIKEAAARKLSSTITELTCQKEAELKMLAGKENKRRLEEIAEAQAVEQKHAEEKRLQLCETHKIEIDKVKSEIGAREEIIAARDQLLEQVQEKREILFNELVLIQADYQDFIDRHPLFDPGQSGYLIPNPIQEKNIEDPRPQAADA